MSESQVPYTYEQADYDALRATLSEARFKTYLQKAKGNQAYAIALYLYNGQLAKSFLFPLAMAEITLRNAVDEALITYSGNENWHTNTQFIGATLSLASAASLQKGLERAGAYGNRHKVIAELTFDFWSNLFRPEYEKIWRTKANVTFPHLPHQEGRKEIQMLVKDINKFRNRVAHYEPILDVNIPDTLSKIYKLIGLRCPITEKWVRAHVTVNLIMRAKPTLQGSNPISLKNKYDDGFKLVGPDTPLIDVLADTTGKPLGIVCQDDSGAIIAGLTSNDLLKYIAAKSRKDGNLIDFTEHTINDILKNEAFTSTWSILPDTAAFGLAIEELKKQSVMILIGVDPDDQKPTGVILRAHRRY